MVRIVSLLIVLLASTPAFAKDVTLTLNEQDQKVFIAILDAALKQGGLSSLQAVSQFVQKFQQASAPVDMPPTAATKPIEPKKP